MQNVIFFWTRVITSFGNGGNHFQPRCSSVFILSNHLDQQKVYIILCKFYISLFLIYTSFEICMLFQSTDPQAIQESQKRMKELFKQ